MSRGFSSSFLPFERSSELRPFQQTARRGEARRGEARRGEARRGEARKEEAKRDKRGREARKVLSALEFLSSFSTPLEKPGRENEGGELLPLEVRSRSLSMQQMQGTSP